MMTKEQMIEYHLNSLFNVDKSENIYLSHLRILEDLFVEEDYTYADIIERFARKFLKNEDKTFNVYHYLCDSNFIHASSTYPMENILYKILTKFKDYLDKNAKYAVINKNNEILFFDNKEDYDTYLTEHVDECYQFGTDIRVRDTKQCIMIQESESVRSVRAGKIEDLTEIAYKYFGEIKTTAKLSKEINLCGTYEIGDGKTKFTIHYKK